MPKTHILSDEALLAKTQQLVHLERKISARLIEHLQEVSRRRLHLQRGFSSLYDYLIRGLGYSGAAAHRRIQAMEICRDLPEVAAKIEQGQVSLTQAMQLQGHFEKEEKSSGKPLSLEIKRELISQVEGLSTRDTEKVFATRFPEAPKPDKKRAISEEFTQITFAADRELMEMIDRIKSLAAHQATDGGLLELFKLMARKTLKQIDPLERAKRARPKPAKHEPAMAPQTPAPGRESRQPDAATLYALHERDQGECQFTDPETGRKCRSRHAVQVEHRVPYSKGGKTELENLELLCRAHNQLRAIREFGEEKIGEYLRS